MAQAFSSKASHKALTKRSKFDEEFTEFVHESVVCVGMGFIALLRAFHRNPLLIVILAGISLWLVNYVAINGYHIAFIVEGLDPKTKESVVSWLLKLPQNYHVTMLTTLLYGTILVILGILLRYKRTKYQCLFEAIGLTNGVGDTPKLVSQKRIDEYRTEYTFDSNSIGLEKFRDKESDLEAAFGQSIDCIKHGDSQKYIKLTVMPFKVPEMVTYKELKRLQPLTEGSFYIGQTSGGPMTKKIEDLPHMMITGATNTGKSVFFKSTILGLLESSPHLQMYLIDLKNGLEFSDFKEAPNVEVYKDVPGAVKALKWVVNEMTARFDYMEKSNLKKIIPEKHKHDRIIVAIDEASVIYLARKTSKYYKLSLEARETTEDLTKLARAAAIHLIFATQKVEDKVVPTTIQENISARVAFQANTLQGSMIPLGTRDALDLPDIPGRGIWNFGAKRMLLQAPYIDGKEIVEACKKIKEDFEHERRHCFKAMLGTANIAVEKTEAEKERNAIQNFRVVTNKEKK